jgi:hypothetical protein
MIQERMQTTTIWKETTHVTGDRTKPSALYRHNPAKLSNERNPPTLNSEHQI